MTWTGGRTWKKGAWEPKRRGTIYCSAACGANCTWADYQKAHEEARALVKALGRGWTPRVWENMGWFYEARRDTKTVEFQVSPSHPGYWASLMGNRGPQFQGVSANPKLAASRALQEAHDYVRLLVKELPPLMESA